MGEVIWLHSRNLYRHARHEDIIWRFRRLRKDGLPVPHDLIVEYHYRRWLYHQHEEALKEKYLREHLGIVPDQPPEQDTLW